MLRGCEQMRKHAWAGQRGRHAPVEDVEKVARDRFPVFRDAVLVDVPSEGRDQLVAVLLNHEADQLLAAHETPAGPRQHDASRT